MRWGNPRRGKLGPFGGPFSGCCDGARGLAATGREAGFGMSLDEIRKQIDAIDLRLVELMNERARLAVEIGRLKREAGQNAAYAPEREREVLERVASASAGPLEEATLRAIWKELMSGSLALEMPAKVMYLGPEGSFSHLAALEKFGRSVDLAAVRDIASVFDGVSRGLADYGIVPVENTTGGAVRDTMECFLGVQGPVKICAEMAMPVHQNLLGKTADLAKVMKVYSKPQVFDQCRGWLSQNLAHADQVAVDSTAEAALLAAKVEGTSAIASRMAAELYGLAVLAQAIEDNPQNQTRFLVLGRENPKPTGRDKTCLLFSTAHRKSWEYYFFVDIEGHRDDEPLRKALEEAKVHTRELRVLGSFPVMVSAG